MDKEKVIELISDAIYQLDPFEMDIDNYDDLCKNATKILYSAKEELQKPDWISVEDELPPIGMRVLVCNIKNPNVIVLDYRSEAHNCKFYDGYGFLIGNHATHWRKIDKLEV